MSERWFVIGHEASNSGAPRMLLEVLRGVRAHHGQDWSCTILLRRGGSLLSRFAELGEVRVLGHPWAESRTFASGIWRKFIDRPLVQPTRFARWVSQWQATKFDLIYNNTATNSFLVPGVRRLRAPILTHVHELADAMRRFNTPEELAQTIENTDHFIAVSPPVAADLEHCGARADAISVVPNFIAAMPPEPATAARANARQELGLRANSRVVVGCGHIDVIKGPDLFVELAATLAATSRESGWEFCWLGAETDRAFARRLRAEVRRRGLDEIFHFVGYVHDPTPWYLASDLVAVTSRTESFSLVALEAAALSRPVIGFAGARGLATVLNVDLDLLAPDHDVTGLAARATQVLIDSAAAQRIGALLRQRVARDFLGPRRIAEIMDIADKLRRAGIG